MQIPIQDGSQRCFCPLRNIAGDLSMRKGSIYWDYIMREISPQVLAESIFRHRATGSHRFGAGNFAQGSYQAGAAPAIDKLPDLEQSSLYMQQVQ